MLSIDHWKEGGWREGGSYAEGIAANIIGTDGQIADLQALDAVDVQTLVEDTAVGGDVAALARCHAACSQGVPGCFDVALDCLVS